MIRVTCPACGLQIFVPTKVQGRSGVCFSCGAALTVPAPREGAPQAPAPPPNGAAQDPVFQPGALLAGRYVIRSLIGRGGMGAVYAARDTLLAEDVALKCLLPGLLRTEKARRMFLQEAQTTRKLRHENIVAVHDVNTTPEGILYISMELAAGESLRELLRRQRNEKRLVEVRFAVSVVSQMLAGLEYAHRFVIHRDIKPENVILLANERVKLLDFGLARAVEEELALGADDPKKKKRLVGTMGYAAPEQVKFQPLDPRADLYAVGLVLQELLTLRTPLDPPRPLDQVRRDVSPSLARVLEKALEEDRERRWTDARAFRAALEEAYAASYRPPAAAVPGAASAAAASTEGMVWFPGGRFLMGSNALREASPEAEVSVAPFWMDAHPVTVAEYRRYLEETGAPPPRYWNDPDCRGDEQPVVGVSWQEAAAYAAWAGKSLPTEAQWEFAARGRENRTYPWGALPPDATRCNFGDHIGGTTMVTLYEDGCTPDGIHDLAGNVFEWTLDPFAPYDTLRNRPDEAAQIPRRAVRGGCWQSTPEELATAARRGVFPETQARTIGFRCVVPAPQGDESA